MYYQTNPKNQNQNQNQANYAQNYVYPTTNTHAQVTANNQYQYPTYTAQPNQLRAQPQYQNIQNVQPIQNYANAQIHQHHKMPNQPIQTAPQQIQTAQHIQTTKPVQNAQNIQYVQVPGKNNGYVQYAQPVQYVQPGQHNQYNIKTNAFDGKQQVKAQMPNQVVNQVIPNQPQLIQNQPQGIPNQPQLIPNQPKLIQNQTKTILNQPQVIQNQPQVIQNQPQIYQNPNLIQTVQVANQMVQPQHNKLIFKAPKPLSNSHRNPQMSPNLGPVNVQNTPHTEIQKGFEQNQQTNNQHFANNTTMMNNQTVNPVDNKNKIEPKLQMPTEDKSKQKKTASFMTVNSLAVLPYTNYPNAEFSKKPFLNISGYASNTYNGKIKNYNEDTVKVQYKVEKAYSVNGKEYKAFISYFGIFDGHGGDNCSLFLKNNLDLILFKQTMFPNNIIESVRETFKTAENKFKQLAVQGTHLNDKSGSCAVIALIVNDVLYSINLGDSRGLYSKDSGKEFWQITRDHKPNDPKEQKRIEKAGGKVYYANKTIINGVEVTLKEEQFGPGFKFPYRLAPGGLAVSLIF